MNCHPIAGTSHDPEVEAILTSLLDDVTALFSSAIDSPSFSTSSFSGENTATSSEAVTDQECPPEISLPVKKKRGRPAKNKFKSSSSNSPSSSKKSSPVKFSTSCLEKKSARRPRQEKLEDIDLLPLATEVPRKRGRQARSSDAMKLSEYYAEQPTCSRSRKGGGCMKTFKRTKRNSYSPDPFADDDEEFERVTKMMTQPRKRTIEAFHHATVFSMHTPLRCKDDGLAYLPFKFIDKYHSGVPDAGIVEDFPNDSRIFKDN